MNLSKPTIYLASSYLADQKLVKDIEIELTKRGVEVLRAPTPYSNVPLKEADYCIAVIREDLILGKGIHTEISIAGSQDKCFIVIPSHGIKNCETFKQVNLFKPSDLSSTLLRKDSYQDYSQLRVKDPANSGRREEYSKGLSLIAQLGKERALKRRISQIETVLHTPKENIVMAVDPVNKDLADFISNRNNMSLEELKKEVLKISQYYNSTIFLESEGSRNVVSKRWAADKKLPFQTVARPPLHEELKRLLLLVKS